MDERVLALAVEGVGQVVEGVDVRVAKDGGAAGRLVPTTVLGAATLSPTGRGYLSST